MDLKTRLKNIPRAMRVLDQWVNWKLTDDGRKVPLGRVNDPRTWKSYAEAVKADAEHIGFVFTAQDNLVGIDIDFKKTPTQQPTPIQDHVLSQFEDCYIELSPSEHGMHVICTADKAKLPHRNGKLTGIKNNDQGIELYPDARYFTVTGNQVSKTNNVPNATPRIVGMMHELKPVVGEHAPRDVDSVHEKPQPAQLREALKFLDPDCSYDQWVNVGMALHAWDALAGLELWETWSAGAKKKYVPGLTYEKWRTFNSANGITIATLFRYAISNGYKLRTDPATDFAATPELMPVQSKVLQDFQQHDAAQLALEDPIPTDWWIEGLLPSRGVLMVGARPKTGKSIMLLQMILSSFREHHFLGAPYGLKRRVLYLDLESSRERAKSRIHKVNGWLTGNGKPDAKFQFDTHKGADGLKYLRQMLEKDGSIRVVVIDTLQKFRGLEDAKGRSVYAEDYDYVTRLLDIANAFNVLLIVVHHTKKGASVIEYGIESMSGSFGLTGAADTVWLLERLKGRGKGQFLLDVHGRDVEQRYLHVECDWELFGWRLVREVDEPWELLAKSSSTTELADEKHNERADAILEALRGCLPGRRGLGYRALNKAMGLTPSNPKLKAMLDELIQLGKVRKEGAEYQLIENSDELLS